MSMGQDRFSSLTFGRDHLAPYACQGQESRGRLFDEPVSPTRTPFQRDRDRIIHSTAFRRLKHKTQVFVHHVGDHYRTRLTHSIEVSQIARALARAFRVDEDLAEALALCHDFGHTPFGHAGEDILNELMEGEGGFDHNAQSLKIVTELERAYLDFDGLNLSWETLEGLVKHNGPLDLDRAPRSILDFDKRFPLDLASHASLEAQCAAIADDIAYNAHDMEDGMRAGLFGFDDLEDLPIAGDTLKRVRQSHPDAQARRVRHEVIRSQITVMVEDVISMGRSNLARLDPQNVRQIRHAGETLIGFSADMRAKEQVIRQFLKRRMYREASVMVMREGARKIIADLMETYITKEHARPAPLHDLITSKRTDRKRRAIADFIAGMTDSYAISEHRRLFDDTPQLG